MENFEIIYNLLAVTMSLTWYTEYVLKHLHNIWHVNLAFTTLATYIHVLKLNADLDIIHKGFNVSIMIATFIKKMNIFKIFASC